eukprot:834314_1
MANLSRSLFFNQGYHHTFAPSFSPFLNALAMWTVVTIIDLLQSNCYEWIGACGHCGGTNTRVVLRIVLNVQILTFKAFILFCHSDSNLPLVSRCV